MAEMGRPRKELKWDEFDKLCGLQCTQKEIAEWFECSIDTIERRVKEYTVSDHHPNGMTFAEYYEQKASPGRVSLRRKQYELAMTGDRVMLIWLGKQYLKQSEKLEQTGNSTITHLAGKSDEELDRRIRELIEPDKVKDSE